MCHLKSLTNYRFCTCKETASLVFAANILSISDAVIQESLRIHGNVGLIMERVVPREGAVIDGYNLPGGTIVGVNPWAIHHNSEIFGEDVHAFRPERWLDSPRTTVEVMRRNLFSVRPTPALFIGFTGDLSLMPHGSLVRAHVNASV